MKQIHIHTPRTQTTLPAHEQAARTRRRHNEHLPAIPGYRTPRTPRPQVSPGRKTFDTRTLNRPGKFEN